MACSLITPSVKQPILPWSEGSGENIKAVPVYIPDEKNTNVKVIFMDKQFKTPLSSRSNSYYSERGFTTLFLSTPEELNSSPLSSPPLSASRPGSLRLGSGALPIAGSWTGTATGPLDVLITGLENFSPFFPTSISFNCLYRIFQPPRQF